jgi:gliding motility-associated lipoprotein GldH
MNTKRKNYFSQKIYYLLFATFLGLSACKSSVYDKIETIPNSVWKKDNPITFKADIQDITKSCDIMLILRHSPHIQYPTIDINMVITTPKGEKTNNFYGIEIRDKTSGELKGDAMGDMCDTEQVLVKGMKFAEKGVYTFTIQHEMEEPILPFMVDLGLKIKVSE